LFWSPDSKKLAFSTAIDGKPGTYTVSSSAPGYKFKSDTHDFQAGGCYWSVHYREGETPPEVNCSLNHGEYKRPVAFK